MMEATIEYGIPNIELAIDKAIKPLGAGILDKCIYIYTRCIWRMSIDVMIFDGYADMKYNKRIGSFDTKGIMWIQWDGIKSK